MDIPKPKEAQDQPESKSTRVNQNLGDAASSIRANVAASVDCNANLEGILSDIDTVYALNDKETGFVVEKPETRKLDSAEIANRYRNNDLFEIQQCFMVSMKVVDAQGIDVGEFTRFIIFTHEKELYIEHDNDSMHRTGTGFGSRFQSFAEEQYKKYGVTAVIRGCGQYVGRYEGAKNVFDFVNEEMRSTFITGFCEYLIENGVRSVEFNGETGIPIDQLGSRLKTPQDILAVKSDRPVISVQMERKNRDTNPPRRFLTVISHKQQFKPEQVGKAFFLDEGSDAKKRMEPDTDFTQYSIGKWAGIKRLTGELG